MEENSPPNAKAKLTEVNSYLTCPLCKGYYIDATTIVECLHSFCRSCIIQHLQLDNYCPICELMINTAKPNIKADKTLQDIVYKLVPGLYAAEMARRRRFWSERREEAALVSCPEARGLMTERIIFSPQDAISLSIEYTSDETGAWQHNSEPEPEVPLRRYLQCPAMLRVEHLKKFICNKYSVDIRLFHVDILYKRVPLPDHYTLMDIAYIYSWKRNLPMKFFFRITDIALVSERFDYFEPSTKQTISTTRPQQPSQRATTKQHTIVNNHNNNNNNIIEKKSASPTTTSDVIKTCDSDNKQTKQKNVISDEKLCSEKNVVKDVCDKNKCEEKSEIIEKCSENKNEIIEKCSENKNEIIEKCSEKINKEPKEIINNNQNESSENSNDIETDKQISENSDMNQVKDDKVVVRINYEVIGEVLAEKVEQLEIKSRNTFNSQIINLKSIVPKEEVTQIYEKANVSSITSDSNISYPTESETESSEASEVINENSEDAKKSQFFMSIQLTAKNASPPSKKPNSSPPALKPIHETTRSKVVAQKRKYVKKTDKSLNLAKKPKLENKSVVSKIRKTVSKDPKTLEESDTILKISKNIKNPIVRLMVSNLNKQASNLSKIVGQVDNNTNNPENNQNDQLKSLIDSCKLNIPSSLSITLTDSPRNEDGTIVPSKPLTMKPVQNYIEILKLPDKISESSDTDSMESSKTSDNPESQNKNRNSVIISPKHTFQTMFEETIKRDESMKAQLFQIQNQAKSLEMAKKAAIKVCVPKIIKKQQNNALDLSITSPQSETVSSPATSPNLEISISPDCISQNIPKRNGLNTHNGTTNKRNILEIAHQLSKRSRLESETKINSPSVSPKPNPSPKEEPKSLSPPQQIIVNTSFSSGGSMCIKKSPKKIPNPRIPISKPPTCNPPKIRNGGLLKFSNYTAKLATNKPMKQPPKSPSNPPNIPSNIPPNNLPNLPPKISSNNPQTISPNNLPNVKTENNTIHGLTPNQLLEKYNITNLAQFNANLNQAQLAFQQALMVSHQLELHRMQQQNSQKHWMSNPNILAHYENYVQNLKNQQNQIIGNSSKN